MQNIVSTKLFYPEGERIVRHSLDQWEETLTKKFDSFLLTKTEEDFLVIINQSSLVSVYLGQIDLAYQICYKGASFFLEKEYLEGIFQPWINIARLHILQKKLDEAKKILNNINPFSNNVFINNVHIPMHSLKPKILSLLKNCYFYENIKVFLSDYKNIEELFVFCDKHTRESKEFYELFLEAEILAFLITNDPLKALKKTVNTFPFVNENFLPIFILRLIDIYIYMKKPFQESKKYIYILYEQHISFISQLNIQGLYFCLEICRRLQILEEESLFMQMSEKLINKFKEINEEVGLIEVLYMRRGISEKDNEHFNKKMNNTKYQFLHNKISKETFVFPFLLGEKIINFLDDSHDRI